MVKKEDLVWHIKRVNNIETNPIESYYCIIATSENEGRMFHIQPFHEIGENGRAIGREPKYFLFSQCGVQKATEEEKEHWTYQGNLHSGYLITHRTVTAIYEDLEKAKGNSYRYYEFVYGYAMSHVVDDTEETSQNHYVVK